MAVACPYCEFLMSIRGAKPGRYTPACQQCKKKFLIIVPENPDAKPTVKAFAEGVAEVRETMHAKAPVKQHAAETALPPPRIPAEMPIDPALPARHHREYAPSPKTDLPDLPEVLGGYRIEKKLGEGGMGAVYLARQISLDRPVAVKVMNKAWAKDSDFIARFTREAYAAAQLSHHNVVQIYDIGVEGDIHYFSMEYVPGKNLAAIVKDQNRLDPEEAAGYALQAARGLKFAHDHGMIHRDIKPENLLLNDQGILKVMDLGLVKTPEGKQKALNLPAAKTPAGLSPAAVAALSTGTTQMNVSMGTPDYMAPEQAADAASVDGRADIYSLGCTLYDFVVGRPPFEGKTVLEVLTKHASQPITPPEVLVKRVPHGLSQIVQKMVAKKKEERFAAMDGVIKDLETFLGISDAGPFTPKEEHASLLESAVDKFNKASLALLRKNLIRAAAILGLIALAICLFFGATIAASAIAGLLVLTPLAYQLIIGITQRTHVFTRVRQLAFGASFIDWLKIAGHTLLAVLVLWIFGLLWVWLAIAAVAVGIALAFALGLDIMVRRQRKPDLESVQTMLKSMRLKGLPEDALRQFVCKYSEKNWEEFYEVLFGYEAKITARELWGRGDTGRARKKFAPWRDGIIAWAQARMKRRQENKERLLLENLEEKSLRSKGASREDAKRKAKEQADFMVSQAENARQQKRRRLAQTALVTAAPPVALMQFGNDPTEADMVAAKRERARVAASRSFGGNIGLMLLGPHLRLALGILALVVCLLWLQQNKALSADRVRSWVTNNFEGGYRYVAEPWKQKIDDQGAPIILPAKMEPLNLPLLSARLTPKQNWQLFNSLSWGIAGLLLLLASFWRGIKISFLILPAAFIMIAGDFLGLPGFLRFDAWQTAYLLGAALALIAFYLGREVA